MMAIMPFTTFAQTTQSKASVHPTKQKTAIQHPLAQLTAKAPAVYCIPSSNCTDGDVITNVTVAGINNTTTCSAGGYGDYTATQGQIEPGQTYPISVTVGDGWFERVSVWIDYDKNETFDATEFLGEIGSGTGSGGVLSGNITIPTSLAAGSYRMRVMVSPTGSDNPVNTDPCDPSTYGETEDYTLVVAAAPTGCLTAPNGQWPATAVTPACNGSVQALTTAGYTGEFSVVNVTSGTAYTFSTSIASYFITIADNAGTTVLASGTGSVQWTSTVTGPVRFYSHLTNGCTYASTLHARSIKCGTAPVEPVYGCDQTYTGVPDLASNITKTITGSASSFAVANDFFVPKESMQYKMKTMTMNLVPLAASGGADIASFDVTIRSDNGNKAPGAIIKTFTGLVPTITSLPDLFANYPTFAATINLGDYELPVNTAENTRYWVTVQANSATTTSIYWIGYKYTEGWVTASNYGSSNGGTTYTQVTSTDAPGQHYDSIWSLDAECATAAVSEAKNKNVSFYPNPVKDFLTINSKKTIETLHIYNVAGQKMPVSSKLVDGKVDMSKLAPGAYIISTILNDGTNESFKVIKK